MSSGDTLFQFFPAHHEPPSSNFMAPSIVAGAPVLAADDTTDEKAIFRGIVPSHYAGGGVTAAIHYAMASATTGQIRLEGSFARASSGQNVNSLSWSTAQAVNVAAVPSSAGNIDIATMTFTAGAQVSSIAAGHLFFFALERKPSDTTNDTAAGDTHILGVNGSES